MIRLKSKPGRANLCDPTTKNQVTKGHVNSKCIIETYFVGLGADNDKV